MRESFLRLAVGAKNGKVYFFDKDSLSFTTSKVPSDFNSAEEVEQISIRNLVNQVGDFNYLSIDIEGGEFEILSSFPWESNRPKFITVEHNNQSEEMCKIKGLMQPLGYRIYLEGVTDFEYWFILDSDQS